MSHHPVVPICPSNLPLADYRPQPALRVPATRVERPAVRAIDAHNHLGRWITDWVRPGGGWMVEDVGALLALMDAVDLEAIVNLDGRWGTELEANLDRYDRAHPGRFLTFCHVDWGDLEEPGRLVASLEASRDAGARGLKVWKDLGLGVRDRAGSLVLPDDPRLADVWAAAGALGLPVLIHTADPLAFFAPLDERNERYDELREHPEWWFGGNELPGFWDLMAQLERVVARHPATTFIGVHMGNCAEDLGFVAGMLERHDNYVVDTSARIGEFGRHDPALVHDFFVRFRDRILFGSDVVRTRALVLPEEGAYAPALEDFYDRHWQFFETDRAGLPHPFPIQGDWSVHGIDLPADVLDALYHANAARVIPALGARSGDVAR
jgi:predicted TIM-barrel fold metal-dependent hydrolase